MAYVPIVGPDGNVWVPREDLTDEELSMVGAHRHAIGLALGGEAEGIFRLTEFENRVVAGVPLVTDLGQLEDIDEAQRLDIEEFYEDLPPV
jgi:hypothetical protein